MTPKYYDNDFFNSLDDRSLKSAQIIVPLITKLTNPRSVIDIGCGRGVWLRVFEENGVSTIRGIDGAYVDSKKLVIPTTCFSAANLADPLQIHEQFDLAVCLEVVEHLPARAGRALIAVITSLAPLVLFSAAIPGQGGTGHINEQWPPYWTMIFEKYNFRRLDPIRREIWQDKRVAWWYRQNIFLYASNEAIENSTTLQVERDFASKMDLEFVHLSVLGRFTTVKGILKEGTSAIWRKVKRELSDWGG